MVYTRQQQSGFGFSEFECIQMVYRKKHIVEHLPNYSTTSQLFWFSIDAIGLINERRSTMPMDCVATPIQGHCTAKVTINHKTLITINYDWSDVRPPGRARGVHSTANYMIGPTSVPLDVPVVYIAQY